MLVVVDGIFVKRRLFPEPVMRSLLSFSKVQRVCGRFMRNNSLQISRDVKRKCYLDLGCGWNTHSHMINLDWQWHPGIDLCWDISTNGIPLPSGSLAGVYSEHCLEHHPPQTIISILNECFRCLRPGGRIRLVLPDVQKYIEAYLALDNGDSNAFFPYPDDVSWEGISSPLLGINRIFYQDRESQHGHCFMFDRHLLHAFLDKVGFTAIESFGFRDGIDPLLLLDSSERWVESFAMEAQRPGE